MINGLITIFGTMMDDIPEVMPKDTIMMSEQYLKQVQTSRETEASQQTVPTNDAQNPKPYNI